MCFYPFALSLRGISIHFFSLSWAVESTVGARRPLQTKNYFFGGKKLLKLCSWLDDRPGVKWSWSCVQLDVGLQDEARWREMGFSENPLLCPFCQELTVLFWGCWASTESLNLNGSRDRGVHTSAPPLSKNQRRKCPWMKHGPQSWLAAREDTRSAGIVFCVLDTFCWAGGRVVCLGEIAL